MRFCVARVLSSVVLRPIYLVRDFLTTSIIPSAVWQKGKQKPEHLNLYLARAGVALVLLLAAVHLASCGSSIVSQTVASSSSTQTSTTNNATVSSNTVFSWSSHQWLAYIAADQQLSIADSSTMKFTLAQNQRPAADVSTVDREEMVGQEKWPFDQDVWVEFDQNVNTGSAITSSWLVAGQLHQTEDSGTGRSPIFAQYLIDDHTLQIVARYSPSSDVTVKPTSVTLYTDTSFVRGQWNHWKYHFKIVRGSGSGLVEGWRNSIKVIDYAGPIGFNNVVGPYWQQGVYRNTSAETISVEYANYSLTIAQ